jgi:hypothetical protein
MTGERARFWWHRARGHRFGLRNINAVVCLKDLAVIRYRPRRWRVRRPVPPEVRDRLGWGLRYTQAYRDEEPEL